MMYRAQAVAHPLVYLNCERAVALDTASGEELWSFAGESPIVRMALAHDQVYLLDQDSMLYILAIETGVLRKRLAASERSAWGAALIAQDDRVLVATSHHVLAVAADGRVAWRWTNREPGVGRAIPGLGLPGLIVQPDLKD